MKLGPSGVHAKQFVLILFHVASTLKLTCPDPEAKVALLITESKGSNRGNLLGLQVRKLT